MAQINAYINFNGNCREAMNFYKESVGGELNIQTVGGSAVAEQMPPEAAQQVLHSMLVKDDLVLMASDMIGHALVQGNSVTLSINSGSEEEGNMLFSNLSSGGQVTHPFQQMFWGAMFGTFTDKFGVNWMVNYDRNANQ